MASFDGGDVVIQMQEGVLPRRLKRKEQDFVSLELPEKLRVPYTTHIRLEPGRDSAFELKYKTAEDKTIFQFRSSTYAGSLSVQIWSKHPTTRAWGRCPLYYDFGLEAYQVHQFAIVEEKEFYEAQLDGRYLIRYGKPGHWEAETLCKRINAYGWERGIKLLSLAVRDGRPDAADLTTWERPEDRHPE